MLLSTLQFLLQAPDLNPGIAAKLGQDYDHALPRSSSPAEGQVHGHARTHAHTILSLSGKLLWQHSNIFWCFNSVNIIFYTNISLQV